MDFFPENLKRSIALANNTHVLSEDNYKALVELCLKDLLAENHSTGLKSINSNKPDVVKELHASLMKAFLLLARNNVDQDRALLILNDCKLDSNKAKHFVKVYSANKTKLAIKLALSGTHAPHIVDVKWKIEYLLKSNTLDEAKGPIFRIELVTDTLENVHFSCSSEELQDLLYKLKDCTLHCSKIGHCNGN